MQNQLEAALLPSRILAILQPSFKNLQQNLTYLEAQQILDSKFPNQVRSKRGLSGPSMERLAIILVMP